MSSYKYVYVILLEIIYMLHYDEFLFIEAVHSALFFYRCIHSSIRVYVSVILCILLYDYDSEFQYT